MSEPAFAIYHSIPSAIALLIALAPHLFTPLVRAGHKKSNELRRRLAKASLGDEILVLVEEWIARFAYFVAAITVAFQVTWAIWGIGLSQRYAWLAGILAVGALAAVPWVVIRPTHAPDTGETIRRGRVADWMLVGVIVIERMLYFGAIER